MPSKKSSLPEKQTQSFNPDAGPGKDESHPQDRNDEESSDAIGGSAGALDTSKEERKCLTDELQTVLEAATVAIWIAHDPQCRHITGNAYADQLIMNVPRGGNISRSAKPGEAAVSYKVFRNGKELKPDELPAQVAAATGQAVNDQELDLVFPDGRTVHLLMGALPLFDAQGRVRGSVATGTDITRMKQAEEALRESHNRFTVLMQNIDTGVALIDEHGNFVIVNPAFLRLFDLPSELSIKSVNDRDWQQWKVFTETGELLDVEDHPVRKAVRTGKAVRDTLVAVKTPSQANLKWMQISAEPILKTDASIKAVICTYHNVTRRKQAEEALRQSRAELEQRVQDRTKELSQTVVALNERSEQLQRMAAELTLAEQRERQRLAQILHDGLQQILVGAKFRLASVPRSQDVPKAMNQVAELIDDAIETSRSLTAELSPPILLHRDLFLALEWLARWMHDKYELNINLIAQQKIEAMTQELIILLFQATRELLFNVVKHAGVKDARVEVNRMDGQFVLTIGDEGSGFDLNRLAEGGRSSGMGLFGIKERLSYMGGRLEIDSAPGQGSRFRLIVPDAPIDMKTATKPPDKSSQVSVAVSARTDTRSTDSLKRTRIMLVDDHLVMRQGLAGLLRIDPDFEIVGEASDGESALVLVRELKPDVVLMDIGMPGMDGIQATRIIHKELPEIHIIGLSMFQEGEQQAAMREAGAVDYITKTGPSEALIEAIRACVRNKE